MSNFIEISPSLDSYWRGIVLFGKNTACYKFALAKSLIEFASKDISIINKEELAVSFYKHICEHIKTTDKQGTNPTNKFLESCKLFNSKQITEEEMIKQTIKQGFRYVFDAFHTVNNEEIPVKFFDKTDTKVESC